MRKIFLFLIFIITLANIANAQCSGTALTVNNPSFEGTPQPHVTPPGWDICMPGVTPDTQPGSWGCTLPPSNGSSYLGLVYQPSTGWQEGAGQTLSSPMVAGTTYNFTIDLATMASADPTTGIILPPWCAELQCWGGMSGVNSGCDMAELLWTSPIISNSTWITYNLSFTPTQPWNHILFLITTPTPPCTDGQYLLVDNMSAIVPTVDIAQFSLTNGIGGMNICAGQSATFQDQSTSVGGVINSWTWNFGDGSPTSTVHNPTHLYSTPGTYNVVLTTTSTVPCTVSVTHQITVYPNPTVVVSGGGSICSGGAMSVPVIFTFTGTGPWNVTYTDGVTPVTQTITTSPYTVNATATGVYSASAVSDAHCTGTCSGTANVVISSNLILTATASPTTICPGANCTLAATGATTYVWMPGNLTGTSVTVNPTTQTTYTVTGTTGICTGSTSVTVNINSSLTVAVTPSNPTMCVGTSVSMTASGGTSYLWTPSTTLSSDTAATVVATPAVTTTYTLGGTAGGCSGITVVTVVVTSGPVISITADPPHICIGDTSKITCNGVATSYTWSPTTTLSNPTAQAPFAFPDTTTTYTVIADNNGCISTSSFTLVVNPLPMPNFIGAPLEGCQNMKVDFTDLTTPAVNQWYWTFGDNITYGDYSYLQNPTHYFENVGTYDVTLAVASADGCTNSITKLAYIITHAYPSAQFAVTPDIVNELDALVWFTDQSTGAAFWDWNFGDLLHPGSNTSSLQNPTHVYADTGVFSQVLIVSTEFGCRDTAYRQVYVEPNFAFYMPNAFTPNGDGKNTIFTPKGEGINAATFEMHVYDRWGKQVCYTRDMAAGWDGKVDGKRPIQGVYNWFISFYDINRRFHSYKGNVTLVE